MEDLPNSSTHLSLHRIPRPRDPSYSERIVRRHETLELMRETAVTLRQLQHAASMSRNGYLERAAERWAATLEAWREADLEQ